MTSFGARLVRAVEERGPICVGIDPHAALLEAWGLPDTVDGLRTFCDTAVAALADLVPVLKPQSAFFERFGSAGIAVMESTIRQSREAGALVIADVKRGDIGSTAAAYARAYLHPASPLYADAITVSPYLGLGSLSPFFDEAAAHGGGVFVLALTSNPEGPQLQHARTAAGRTVGNASKPHGTRARRALGETNNTGLCLPPSLRSPRGVDKYSSRSCHPASDTRSTPSR